MAKDLMGSVNELQVVISNGLTDVLHETEEIHAKLLEPNFYFQNLAERNHLMNRYYELKKISDYYKLINDVTNDFVRQEVPGLGEIMDMLDILNATKNSATRGP